MKLLSLLLTLLIGISCAHRNPSRSPQSVALPVVQIVSNSTNNLEVNVGESVKLKYSIYDSLGTPVSGKVVNFYFSGNAGHFQNNQVTSDEEGVVENTFITQASEEIGKKRITFELFIERAFIGRLTSTQFLTINADPKLVVLKKFNSLSLVSSSFEWVGDKNLVANAKREYNLAFIPRDQSGEVIKSDGKFLVNFLIDGTQVKGQFFTDQTYRTKIKTPTIFGKKIFKVEVRNGYNEEIHYIPEFVADFKPDYNLDKINIVKNEVNKKSFNIDFSLLDINEQTITSEYLPEITIKDEGGNLISFEKNENLMTLKGDFPYGKGQKVFNIQIAQGKLKTPIELSYNTFELAWDDIEFKLDKNYLHPFFVKPGSYDIKQELESTNFTLKLVDSKENPLQNLEDMNLSLETKIGRGVFSPLQIIAPGEFRGTFSPENNEQGKVVFLLKNTEREKELPTSLKIGFIPKNNLIGKSSDWTTSMYSDELTIQMRGNESGETVITGFSFENNGVNAVVPKGSACDSDPQDRLQASRSYVFDFESQSRQGTRLYIRDNTSSWDSKNRHTSLYFFPRNVIFSFKNLNKNELEVTLPTNEKFVVNRESGEFLTKDILADMPIDMGTGYPQCSPGKAVVKRYPEVNYKGKGVVLKVNNPTGSYMPEDNAREITAQVYYFDEVSGKQIYCPKLFKTDFFTNGVLKFTSDQAMAQFLKVKCGEAFFQRINALLTP